MYEAYYKLSSDPFRLLPDPEICFPHRSCAKAWAYLRYALKRGEGIVAVTGPPGSGKTTLADRLLRELNPARTVGIRLIANELNPTDLLRRLAYSFGLPAEGLDRAMLAHRLERYLVDLEHSSRQALIIIDEAQTLSHQSLEAMRLLTDLQSRSRPVLQLFLLGQEGLEEVMASPDMTQFQQRVIASCRLDRMDLAETKAYLEYRLAFADWQGDPSINGPAVMAIFRYSRGLPRHVNKICSRLLLHGCTEEKHSLKQRDVLAVVKDLRKELLAPIDDVPDARPEIVGTDFESVDELALKPTPAVETIENTDRHSELNTLFLADEPPPTVNEVKGTEGQTFADRRERWRSRRSHYLYRPGQRSARRVGRWFHRLSHLTALLANHIRHRACEWWPLIVTGFSRLATIVSTGAAGTITWLRNSEAGQKSLLKKLHGRVNSLPTAAMAGFAGIVATAVVLMAWNKSDEPLQSAAAGPVPSLDISAAKPTHHNPVLNSSTPGDVDAAKLSPDAPSSDDLLKPSEQMPGNIDLVQDTQDEPGRDQPLITPETVVRRNVPDEVAALANETRAEQVTVATVYENEQPVAEAGEADKQVAAIVSDESTLDVGDPLDFSPTHADEPSGDQDDPADLTPIRTANVTSGEPALSDDDTGAAFSGQMAPMAGEATPDPSIDAVELQRGEIERLLTLADSAMENDRLTRPREDSAYRHLQAVLAIDPYNQNAYAGLDRIVRRYAQMADLAIGRQAFSTASRYINRGLNVDPLDLRLRALRTEVDSATARKEREALAAAKFARVAAEVTPGEPVLIPEQEPEVNLYNLMRSVDGEN